MTFQEDPPASIDGRLNLGDISNWVARSYHDALWLKAGHIVSPPRSGGKGGSEQNQQSDGSHERIMRSGAPRKPVKSRCKGRFIHPHVSEKQ
jgi:hypothetical protein